MGINTDVLNERMLKAADLIRPLGIHIIVEPEHACSVESTPKGMIINSLDVRLEFTEPKKDWFLSQNNLTEI